MKTIKKLLAFVTLTLCFASCEDNSVKAILKSDVEANVLEAPSAITYVLTLDQKNDIMETFEWSATDFGFDAAVLYRIQLDVAGNSFAKAIVIASTNDLEAEVMIGPLNDQLLGLGLNPEEATNVELRIVSTINDKVEAVYSNTKAVTITAYATSFPPIYARGAALKGWGSSWPGEEVEMLSAEFKKYETVAYFTSGEAFRFFAQLDWNPTSYNYPYFTTVSPIFVNANDGDSNLKVAGASGWYKVGVNLKDKIVTALAVAEPLMYMTGPGVGAWDQPGSGASVKMTYVKPGVFSILTNFNNNGAFRFFAQADWGPTSYNYPYFSSVAADFVNAADGDSNLKYVGVTGAKKITVDLNTKTVTTGNAPVPVLYMTGPGVGAWDQPGTGASVSMTYKSPGVFESTTNFNNGQPFRFFAQADWGPTSYNYPYFTTVDSNFTNAADGDSNLRFVGATGSHKITVNLTTKVVSFTP